MSERLSSMVTDPVQRTYLVADDGFWADTVLTEFSFLERRGGQVVAVRFHQNGDYVIYRGPWGEIVLEFFPDGNVIGARASLASRGAVFEGHLDSLSRQRHPNVPLPSTLPLDRRAISANVRFWADLLRSTPDLM